VLIKTFWSSSQFTAPEKAMSTTKAARGKVLAEFAENIDDEGGWWFRAPKSPKDPAKDPTKDPDIGKEGVPNASMPPHPDGIMPQLGALFFLDESAMLAMLQEMGCYNRSGNGFEFNKTGWENLVSEFKIPPRSFEISVWRCGKGGPKNNYIKICNTSKKPQDIYKEYLKDPKGFHTPSVSTRQTRKRVAESLAQSLRESGAFKSMVDVYSKMMDPYKITRAARIRTENLAEEGNCCSKAKEPERQSIAKPN
jgi:hypothetical protein